jgi:SRSO17 transposase
MIETAPVFELTTADVQDFVSELEGYRTRYHDLFRRREQREQYDQYLQGLLLDLPNKAVETMVLHMNGDDANAIRRQQHFISHGRWPDHEILERHWSEVAQDLGDPQGVLIIDESGFPKQGTESVGVKRQWCGQLGKRANCQVGVFAAYATSQGYTLLDRRLYLPREWVEDPTYTERRATCGVPDDVPFLTKPELALEMIAQIHRSGHLPFGWVVCDEGYGRSGPFLDQVASYAAYFAEVPADTHVWLERPATAVPAWTGKGRKPVQAQLLPGEPAAQEVRTLAATLPDEQWSRHTIKEGSKGLLEADFALLRVVAVRHGLPGPDVWLLLRRDVASGELKYFVSNAAAETPLATFVWLSGMRWPVERCFEDGKQELGLGDYQLRSWTGWHHHMTLCILAHFFLVRLQIRLKDRAPALTLPQTILLLKSVLPKPELDPQQALDIVNYYQRRQHAARLSHRKRRRNPNR